MLEFNDGALRNVVMAFDVDTEFSESGDRVEKFNTEIRDEEFD